MALQSKMPLSTISFGGVDVACTRLTMDVPVVVVRLLSNRLEGHQGCCRSSCRSTLPCRPSDLMSHLAMQRLLPQGHRPNLQARISKHFFSCDRCVSVLISSPPGLQERSCSRWFYRQVGLEQGCCRGSCWVCYRACRHRICVFEDPTLLVSATTHRGSVFRGKQKVVAASHNNTRCTCTKTLKSHWQH